MCASVGAAFSTIVCQLGVFSRDQPCSQSHTGHEQVCSMKKWSEAKGTTKETRGCLFNYSFQAGNQHLLSHKQDVISSQTRSRGDLFSLCLQPIDALKMTTATESKS